ncbi:hypothetical protein DYB31_006105 [Aphanomyces astaci]|uniref:Carboxypeptidase n=1 Tax=Aphanomyces astaci TaxID=112090 RepID=A0A397EI65_APHAT|nr:hypothetical protein DYB31_006105 [Aphanomyces astaci]
MVFLESPAGVGFSQPVLNDTDYNDNFTTNRAYEFLAEFYAKYPRYKNREFYITGESYAGIYIPFLVHKLVQEPISNVKLTGFAIGNPFTDSASDGGPNCTQACADYFMDVYTSSSLANPQALNPYNIYGDVCLLGEGQSGALHYHNIRASSHRGAYKYYYTTQVVVSWSACNFDIAKNYHRTPSTLDKYPVILEAGLKALIYSGDADSVVNFIGTQRWLTKGLKLSVQDKWKAWFAPDKQLGGFTVRYTNLTFTTIKGAGHMVPATRPLHALYLFECFVYGQVDCDSFAYPKDELEYLSGADLTAPSDIDRQPEQRSNQSLLWAALGLVVAAAAGVVGTVLYLNRAKKTTQYVELTAGQPKPVYSN